MWKIYQPSGDRQFTCCWEPTLETVDWHLCLHHMEWCFSNVCIHGYFCCYKCATRSILNLIRTSREKQIVEIQQVAGEFFPFISFIQSQHWLFFFLSSNTCCSLNCCMSGPFSLSSAPDNVSVTVYAFISIKCFAMTDSLFNAPRNRLTCLFSHQVNNRTGEWWRAFHVCSFNEHAVSLHRHPLYWASLSCFLIFFFFCSNILIGWEPNGRWET